jgi:hypothetical protein
MVKGSTYFLLLFLAISALFSCTESAKPKKNQVVHLYSDFLAASDSTIFINFEKKWNIQVFIHHISIDSLRNKIATSTTNSGADMVLISEPSFLNELESYKWLYRPKNGISDGSWQRICLDPFVFEYNHDTLAFYTTYGQILRDKRAKVSFGSNSINKKLLINGLHNLYPRYSISKIEKVFFGRDSILRDDYRKVHILLNSEVEPKKKTKTVFPDQNYNGSFGKTAGMGVVRNAQNMANSLLLFTHCQQEDWRKKIAQKNNCFEILNKDRNKQRNPLFHQNNY